MRAYEVDYGLGKETIEADNAPIAVLKYFAKRAPSSPHLNAIDALIAAKPHGVKPLPRLIEVDVDQLALALSTNGTQYRARSDQDAAYVKEADARIALRHRLRVAGVRT